MILEIKGTHYGENTLIYVNILVYLQNIETNNSILT